MKIFLVFGLICFSSINVYAVTACSDTIPQGRLYKISRHQFLEKYGENDTARAIINYYFTERKTFLWETIVAFGLAAMSAMILERSLANNSSREGWTNFIVAFAFVVFGWMGAVFILLGGYMFLHYSRKRLLKILNDYFSGKGLPASLRKSLKKNKRLFKKAAHVSD